MKLEDWAKVDVDEIRERWAKKRIELEEVEKKKAEREKRIDEAKKRKEEKRKREGVLFVRFLGIWPITAGIEKRKMDRHRCPQIDLKC